MEGVVRFVRRHAFAVVQRKNFQHLGTEFFPDLCRLFGHDAVNVKEADLLHALFRLCANAAAGGSAGPTAMELFMREWPDADPPSLWACVRLRGLTAEDVFKFCMEASEEERFDDAFRGALTQYLYELHHCPEPPRKVPRGVAPGNLGARREYKQVSSYPWAFTFDREASAMHVVYSDDDARGVAFVAVKGPRVAEVPPVSCFRGDVVLQCNVSFGPEHLGVSGVLTPRRAGRQEVTVEASVVNFRHDKWKRSSVVVPLAGEAADFRIPAAIATATLDQEGYRFAPRAFPDYQKGAHVLLRLRLMRGDSEHSEIISGRLREAR
jgi:hypothetical protein